MMLRSTVLMWGAWNGKAENPTVDVLDRLAATLAVPLSEFFKKPRRGASPPSRFGADERRFGRLKGCTANVGASG
jgi:transcriptional regulator with XRE-family HTH domain